VAEAGSDPGHGCLAQLEQRMTICFARALGVPAREARAFVPPCSLTFREMEKQQEGE